MSRSVCALSLIYLLSAPLRAQMVVPSDTAAVFRQHILARLSGSRSETVTAIKAGPNGEIYIAGNTTSDDFPTKNAAQPESPEGPAMSSTDGGRTWIRFTPPPPAGAGPPFPDNLFLRAHPSISGLLFAAAGATLWRSSDAGQTWKSVFAVRPGEDNSPGFVAAIGFDPAAPGIAYLLSTDGLSVSADAGSNWQVKARSPPVPSYGSSIWGKEPRIEIDPRGSGALLAPYGSTAALSRDGGNTWTSLRPPTGQTSSVATFSRSQEGRIYAGVGAGATGSLWVSNDWGRTWSQTKAQPTQAVVDLFTDPEAPNRLYAVTLGTLLVSEDGAESWTNANSRDSLGYQVSKATGCGSGSLLVASQGWATLSFSPDRGQTWRASPVRDVQKFTAGAGCSVYALKSLSGDAFVARLDRMGETAWSTYLADVGSESVTTLTTDPAGNVLVAGTAGTMTDVLLAKYSSDGQLLWKKTLGGSSWDTPSDIAADAAGNILIAGRTSSADFPLSAGAVRSEPGAGFVMKLDPSGQVLWATYLEAAVQSLAIEPTNSVLLAGSDRLLRLDAAGASCEALNTLVPRPAIVRTDALGNAFIAGIVLPDETPLTPGAYASPIRARVCAPVSWAGPFSQSRSDLQVARLRAGTLEPEFSALLGGECGTRPDSLDVAPDGRVAVGFVTQSHAFDVRASVASAGFCSSYDLATGVAELSPDGSQLLRSTLLEGCSQIRVAVADTTILTASDNSEDALVLQAGPANSEGPRLDRIANAFSGTGLGISPGELVSLHGAGLGPAEAIDLGINPQMDLPAELGGTQVLLNGTPMRILRAAAEQVIFTAPFRIDGTSATVQVNRNGQSSNSVLAPIVASNAALLAAGFPSTDPETSPFAIARNSDGTVNGPSNPAREGSTVWVFATGLGATNLEVEAGRTATTDTLAPATLFRETRDLPFSPSPFPAPPSPINRIHAMPSFLNSIFAVPVTARESADQPMRQLVTITSAQWLRGTSRRSISPAVTISVCKPGLLGNCPTE